MVDFAKQAYSRGFKVIIAGAAAHLPGMVAALTPLSVITEDSKGWQGGVPRIEFWRILRFRF